MSVQVRARRGYARGRPAREKIGSREISREGKRLPFTSRSGHVTPDEQEDNAIANVYPAARHLRHLPRVSVTSHTRGAAAAAARKMSTFFLTRSSPRCPFFFLFFSTSILELYICIFARVTHRGRYSSARCTFFYQTPPDTLDRRVSSSKTCKSHTRDVLNRLEVTLNSCGD